MSRRRDTAALAAALAAGTMVAGLVPSPEPAPAARPARRRPANGAQLAMWREQDRAALLELQAERKDNRSRRLSFWERWTMGWKRKSLALTESRRRPRAARRAILASQGRPFTGRQWRKLRKEIRRQGRAA